jgi:hypothetical protein
MVFEDPETHDEVVGVVVVKGVVSWQLMCIYRAAVRDLWSRVVAWWLARLACFFFLCADRKQGVQEVRCQVGYLYHHFSCFMLIGVGYAVPSEKRYLSTETLLIYPIHISMQRCLSPSESGFSSRLLWPPPSSGEGALWSRSLPVSGSKLNLAPPA